MKVLYFHQHFSTPRGAAGTRSYEMARELLLRGHQVVMVCGKYENSHAGDLQPLGHGSMRGYADGIDVVQFDLPYSNRDGFIRRSLTFLKYSWKSILLTRSESCDLIFATSTPLTAGIPGIVAKILRVPAPFVFEVRDLWPELPRAMGVIRNPLILMLLGLLEWSSYRAADHCIALSPGIRDGIARRTHKSKPITLVPNGSDVELFSPANAVSLSNYGIRSNEFVAVFTGAHGLANGLDSVLDCATVLKARGDCRVRLLLIGEGRLKSALIQKARDADLHNVTFLPAMPKDELARLLPAVGTGLMILANVPAFYFGTSPNKFFDYVAAGLPVVNNYPGWLAGIIEGNECGIVVPPGDPEALADALQRLAANPTTTEQMGHRSRALAESTFNRSRLAAEFADVLERTHALYFGAQKQN